MPISLKANSDGSAEILNGVQTAITISPNGNVKASGMQGYNYIINGNFDIWQRGTSQTTARYGSADRWACDNNGTTKTASRQTFTLGQTGVPDNPKYYMRHVVTSVAGANNHCVVNQRIEYVKTLAGKTATLSFWAKADSSKNIAIEFIQSFGTGGTPSSSVVGIGAQLVALTTSWAKYTVTVYIPSIAGKTLGTADNDYLGVLFWFDAGSSLGSRTANLGHQSGTFDIACVSLVEGDVDVKPIPRRYGEELALCKRYYHLRGCDIRFRSAGPGHVQSSVVYFDTQMRTNPIFSFLSTSATLNVAAREVQDMGPNASRFVVTAAAAGDCYRNDAYSFDSEL